VTGARLRSARRHAIGAIHPLRQAGARNGSAKYCVSYTTLPSRNSSLAKRSVSTAERNIIAVNAQTRVGPSDHNTSRPQLRNEDRTMTVFKNIAVVALMLLAARTANAQQTPPQAIFESLMTKALADYPGKEGLVLTVVYPPGAAEPVHRHNAHAFIYVLEGSVVMGIRGGKSVTLTPGQTFYEGPNDVHTIGRNASSTKPAKFLVVLLKNSDEPVAAPAN
jgi:quercetin dioxygenase-like cupin family protein